MTFFGRYGILQTKFEQNIMVDAQASMHEWVALIQVAPMRQNQNIAADKSVQRDS